MKIVASEICNLFLLIISISSKHDQAFSDILSVKTVANLIQCWWIEKLLIEIRFFREAYIVRVFGMSHMFGKLRGEEFFFVFMK